MFYEEMKIGLFNGSYLVFIYLGFLCGYCFVYEIFGDLLLCCYVWVFMDCDVVLLLVLVLGIDLECYKDSLVECFVNCVIVD